MTFVDLADFGRDAGFHAAKVVASKEPTTLTVDGRASVVVQDAASYQAMVGYLHRAEAENARWLSKNASP